MSESKYSEELPDVDWCEADKILDGDDSMLQEIFEDLFKEAKDMFHALDEAIDKKDYDTIMRSGHKLKGTAANLYCMILKHHSAIIQTLGKKGLTDPSDELLDEIIDHYKASKEAVARLSTVVTRRYN